MITLRVTDEMIQDWQEHYGLCPLARAFQLTAQDINLLGVDNAIPNTGEIVYRSPTDDHWYRIYPIPQDTQPVIAFISEVDVPSLTLPRKRIFHYGEPQQY